jgi:hypothetical protein
MYEMYATSVKTEMKYDGILNMSSLYMYMYRDTRRASIDSSKNKVISLMLYCSTMQPSFFKKNKQLTYRNVRHAVRLSEVL